MKMDNHEYANLFPLMNSKEFKELKADIKEHGQQDPIVLFGGKILDGRNRFNACEELDIEPKTKEYRGKNALQYVMSTNLKRRHLTDSQKAVVGRRYKKQFAIWARERQGTRGDIVEPVPQSDQARARDQAGDAVGVSGRYIDMADKVIEANPGMEEKIMTGEVKVKTAYREMQLKEQREQLEENIEDNKISGTYDVVVIDPPWDYGTDNSYDADSFRGTTPYPTMSLKEIKNIEIPSNEDCVLWLWTTNKFLLDMKPLLESWGFELKSILTWDKDMIGIGRWLRSQTEHCILAVKGKPFFNNKKWSTLIREKRTTHSTKPEIFYTMVDEICGGRKLDYFARKKRKGWDVYGDEV